MRQAQGLFCLTGTRQRAVAEPKAAKETVMGNWLEGRRPEEDADDEIERDDFDDDDEDDEDDDDESDWDEDDDAQVQTRR